MGLESESSTGGLFARTSRVLFGPQTPEGSVDEETARRIRGEQVAAIVELTPMSAAANLLCAGLITVAFIDTSNALFAPLWLAAIATFAAMALRNWWSSRARPRAGAGPRAISRLTINSLILACLWGLAPIMMLPGADTFHQLLLQILVTGMSAGGAFGLSTVPRAANSYVWIIVASSALAMLIAGSGESVHSDLMVVALWIGYGLYLSRNIAIHAARFYENARNRAELTEKNEVIGLLLKDFQEHGGDWLWETDAEGRLVDPSPRFAEVAGRTLDEVSGMQFRALLAAGQADGDEQLLDAME